MCKPQHWVSVDRIVNAGAHDLYAAWTVPQIMAEWMGESVAADVRVGGSYRIENGAGGQIHFHEGRYLVLEPGRRIAQTFRSGPLDLPDGALPFSDEFIDVTFRALGPTQTFVRLFNGWNGAEMDDAARQAMKQAWSGWLDRLAALF